MSEPTTDPMNETLATRRDHFDALCANSGCSCGCYACGRHRARGVRVEDEGLRAVCVVCGKTLGTGSHEACRPDWPPEAEPLARALDRVEKGIAARHPLPTRTSLQKATALLRALAEEGEPR